MLFLIVTLISVVCNLVLGLMVFYKNPGGFLNRIFLIFTLILMAWATTNYLSLQPFSPETTLFWIRMVMVVTAAMFPSLYLAISVFPNSKTPVSKVKLMSILLFTVLTQAASMSSLVFSDIKVENGNVVPVPGPAIGLYGLNLLGFLILILVTLYRKNRQVTGTEKIQLRYLNLGIALTFISATVTNFLFVILLRQTSFVAFGPIFSLILVGCMTYAIIRHRLLDISLIVARAVAYSILITIISIFFVTPTFLITSYLLELNIELSQVVIYTILTVLVSLSFQRLKIFTERFTDKFFFKGEYESDDLLSSLAHIMGTEIELHQLTHNILDTLVTQMRITKGAFVLYKGQTFYDLEEIGYGNQLNTLYPHLDSLLKQEQVVVFDELEEGEIKNLMRQLNASLSQVLKVKGEAIGLLILGQRASGEVFSSKDLKILEILAPEMAVAIQNSLSFDEIKRFNITLRQEVEKATADLQTANKKLQELDNLKDDFVSVASHELRTPMTAIRSYAWMALNRSDTSLSERVKKYLVRVLISTERLINLVNDMLNISRIESGKIEIKPRVFDIQALVKDIMTELTPKASEKGIQLKCAESKVPQVFADPEKVYQVVLNIVGNALKFTPEKGLVQVNFFTDGLTVDVSTKDSGVGIAKEDLSSLFQKFGRLDNSYIASATSGGTGLGLFICKSLVELMKGKIWANSEGMGKGTTVTFSLPVANPETLSRAHEFTYIPPSESKQLEPVTVV